MQKKYHQLLLCEATFILIYCVTGLIYWCYNQIILKLKILLVIVEQVAVSKASQAELLCSEPRIRYEERVGKEVEII